MVSGIFRAHKEREYVSIDNDVVENCKLSWKARGILCYLLSRPPNWKVRTADLLNRSDKDGKDALRSGIAELMAAGFIHRQSLRNDKGQIVDWEYAVYERSVPQAGNPNLDNPPSTKTDMSVKQKSKEAKGTPSCDDVCVNLNKDKAEPAMWQPDERSKEQKLATIKAPDQFPSEREFDRYVEDYCPYVADHRPDMYSELCDRKWRHWNTEHGKWVKIWNWRNYVSELDNKIENAN